LLSNPGFYISIIFLLLTSLTGILYVFKTRKINKYLPIIIYFDCKGFEEKDNPDKYFLEKPSSQDNGNIDVDQPERKNESLTIEERNILQLYENKATVTDREDILINNKVELNSSHKKNTNNDMTNITVERTITLQDYEELTPAKQLTYDKRKNLSFLKDQLAIDHPLFSLLFKRSLIDPLFLRVYQLVFSLSMQFAANAMFYTDSYIDKRLNNQAQVHTN
jgi:hypothetical protein